MTRLRRTIESIYNYNTLFRVITEVYALVFFWNQESTME